MQDKNLVDTISDKLHKYPDIKFSRIGVGHLEIYPRNSDGFVIRLLTSKEENTLFFGEYHWQFANTEEGSRELLDQLTFGLTGVARVKEYSKNGRAFKWILQMQDEKGSWYNSRTTGVFTINFWTKPRIRYFINDLLPIKKLRGN